MNRKAIRIVTGLLFLNRRDDVQAHGRSNTLAQTAELQGEAQLIRLLQTRAEKVILYYVQALPNDSPPIPTDPLPTWQLTLNLTTDRPLRTSMGPSHNQRRKYFATQHRLAIDSPDSSQEMVYYSNVAADLLLNTPYARACTTHPAAATKGITTPTSIDGAELEAILQAADDTQDKITRYPIIGRIRIHTDLKLAYEARRDSTSTRNNRVRLIPNTSLQLLQTHQIQLLVDWIQFHSGIQGSE